jgi:carboxymethylenebutenolidase
MRSDPVTIETADGAADAYFVRPSADGPHPGVLFLMDAIGLRPRLREMADRIATAGYAVLVPNLFYRNGTAPLVDVGDLLNPANRPTMMATLGPFFATLTPDRAISDFGYYLDFLGKQEGVNTGPVGVTGYCFGGAHAVRAAGAYGDRIAAAASFHGGNLATDAAGSPHLLAGGISASVYIAHADNDPSASPEQQERLNSALDAAGVDYRAEVYTGAQHGFTMTDTAAYNPAAEERHWTELLALFDRAVR